jgi:Ca2+-binding EF-hand superfamily protein
MHARGDGGRDVRGSTVAHEQITKTIRAACASGMRQMFGLAINSATDFFFALDRDRSGYAERPEIAKALLRLGNSVSAQQIEDWVTWLDDDGSGEVDAIEFVRAVEGVSEEEAMQAVAAYQPVKAAKATRERKQKKPKGNSVDTHVRTLTKKLKKVLARGHHMIHGCRVRSAVDLFNAIDQDHSGSCDNIEIVQALNSLHMGVTKHDVMHWLRAVDEDQSGHVDAAEFIAFIVGRPATEAELAGIKGGKHVMSDGRRRTDNLKKGTGSGTKTAAEKMTTNILLALESSCRRSIFGHFVTDARSLFFALDRDASGAVDKDELVVGLRRLGVAHSIKQVSDWVNHLDMNEDGEITRETFCATLNHTNRLTRQVHEACHESQRNMYGMAITDAASFFFALDRDKSGDLTTEEIREGLVHLGAQISMAQAKEFTEGLDKDASGTIDAIEFVRAVDYVDAKEAEQIVNKYVPVTHMRLVQEEKAEQDRINKKLKVRTQSSLLNYTCHFPPPAPSPAPPPRLCLIHISRPPSKSTSSSPPR